MRFYNRTQLAKLLGMPVANISHAVTAGTIVFGKDGIDLANPDTIYYAEKRCKGPRTTAIKKAIQEALDEAGSSYAPIEITEDIEDEKPVVTFDGSDLDRIEAHVSEYSKADIEKLKSLEMIRKLRFKNAQDRGEFISRELVSKIFYKLYAIDKSEFVSLATNVAPDIAGICGIDDDAKIVEIRQVMEAQIYRILEHIKRLIDEFLQGE